MYPETSSRSARLGLGLALAAIVALLGLSGVAPTASAGTAATGPQGVIDDPDSIAYARGHDVSIEEAARRLELQSQAGLLSAWVNENGAQWSGGVYVTHEPQFGVVVSITDREVSGLAEQIDALSLGDVATYSLVEFTAAELQQDAAALRQELPEELIYVDVKTNAVVVEGPSEAAVAQGTVRANPRSQPRFEFSSRHRVTVANIYAGKVITWDEPGAPPPIQYCTTGFSVVQAGVRRITTAGHCVAAPLLQQGVTLGLLQRNFQGSHDEQLMSTGTLIPTNRTHDGSRDTQTPGYRLINGKRARASQAIGSFFCRYGWASAGNYGCGHLVANDLFGGMPSPNATSMLLLADSGDDLASPGDSGGPVFTSSTALGIMHQCISEDPECDNPNLIDHLIYVAIDYVEQGLGATVLTVP